jgi:hypothetical protein
MGQFALQVNTKKVEINKEIIADILKCPVNK